MGVWREHTVGNELHGIAVLSAHSECTPRRQIGSVGIVECGRPWATHPARPPTPPAICEAAVDGYAGMLEHCGHERDDEQERPVSVARSERGRTSMGEGELTHTTKKGHTG